METTNFLILACSIFLLTPTIPAKSAADTLPIQHTITCQNKKLCPEGLAKLVVTENSDSWKCTGFLITDKIVMTNRHCLPDDIIQGKTQDCSGNIKFFFPASGSFQTETLACNQVLTFSKLPDSSNVASLDYAFLELTQSTQRKFFALSHEGIKAQEKLTLWRADGIEKSVVRKDQCQSIYRSLLFPFTNDPNFPVATLDHCSAEHGNSGSPLLNKKGEVVAILEGMNNEKNGRFFEDKFGTKKMKNIIKASNLACIKAPSDDFSLPIKCYEARKESDFLKEGNQILADSLSSKLSEKVTESAGIRWKENVLYGPEYGPLSLRKDRFFAAIAPSCYTNKDVLKSGSTTLEKSRDQKYTQVLSVAVRELCPAQFSFTPEMQISGTKRANCKKAKATLLFSLPADPGADIPFYYVIQDAKENVLAFRETRLPSCDQKVTVLEAFNSDFGTLTMANQIVGSSPIIVIPQWHLAPDARTNSSIGNFPQQENQIAIYKQLAEWEKAHYLKTVVVEGCAGEINDDFHESFNGWNLTDLKKKIAEGKSIDDILTQVGLKVKAQFGTNVKVVCGDDLDLLKKHQMALSNLRGLLGFKLRINQYKNDPANRKDYIAAARTTLKLPTKSKDDEVVNQLDQQAKMEFQNFINILQKRNETFAKTALQQERPLAIVIGAIHIKGLEELLKNQPVQVFTPKGLAGDEDMVIEQMKNLLESQ